MPNNSLASSEDDVIVLPVPTGEASHYITAIEAILGKCLQLKMHTSHRDIPTEISSLYPTSG